MLFRRRVLEGQACLARTKRITDRAGESPKPSAARSKLDGDHGRAVGIGSMFAAKFLGNKGVRGRKLDHFQDDCEAESDVAYERPFVDVMAFASGERSSLMRMRITPSR